MSILVEAVHLLLQRLFGSVSGGDPGYDETAKMVSEAALMLAARRAEFGLTGLEWAMTKPRISVPIPQQESSPPVSAFLLCIMNESNHVKRIPSVALAEQGQALLPTQMH